MDDGKMAGITMPPTANYSKSTLSKDFIRSYYMNATGGQTEYPRFAENLPGYGSSWKKEVKSLFVAQARVWIAGGEMLAQKDNRVELDPEVKDKWGIPVLKIHLQHCDNDRKLIAHFQAARRGAVPRGGRRDHPERDAAGRSGWRREHRPARSRRSRRIPRRARVAGRDTASGRRHATPPPAVSRRRDDRSGLPPLGSASIHEVGTARMSASPKDGVLNSYCQTHDIPNLYVFGGNAYPSTGDKHPTLTFMALAVRGCDHIIEQVKGKGRKKA